MRHITGKLFLSVVILIFLFLKPASSSHLVGGYIYYEHLSGNDYKVNLHLFYDCAFALPDDSIPMCLKSATLNYDSTVVMYFDTSNIFPYHSCMGSFTSCLQGGTNWGMGDNVFSCVVTLPNPASDWRFSASVCCRNAVPSTVNGFYMGIISVYTYATLDNLNVAYNSSPQFNSNMMPVFCLGVFTVNNFGCTDPDGDSLVYEIDSTFTRYVCSSDTPVYPVVYNSPYDYLNFLDSSTPVSMNLSTGALSFTPSMIETSVYSVGVDEYRNGLKIGSFKRQEEILIVPAANGISFPDPAQDKLLISPNPANTTLDILQDNPGNIVITDLHGKSVLQKKFSNIRKGKIELDISFLSPGIYFIKSGSDAGKFVKE